MMQWLACELAIAGQVKKVDDLGPQAAARVTIQDVLYLDLDRRSIGPMVVAVAHRGRREMAMLLSQGLVLLHVQ